MALRYNTVALLLELNLGKLGLCEKRSEHSNTAGKPAKNIFEAKTERPEPDGQEELRESGLDG